MPQTRDCDYCGGDIEPGTGTMFVSVTGSVAHYCSSKCEKNADLGREPRDLEWTTAGGAGVGARQPSQDEESVDDSPSEEVPVNADEELLTDTGTDAAGEGDDGPAEALDSGGEAVGDGDAELDEE